MQRGSTTGWYIKSMFDACCWHGLQSVRVDVEVEPGRVLKVHRLRIKERRHAIARMLQNTRRDIHRSVNPKGMPWRAVRSLSDGCTLDEQAAEQFVALGVAAGFVTIVPRKVDALDSWIQHFVVIEDVLIENWLGAERRGR